MRKLGFILQIGHLEKSAGSNDTENLSRPWKMQVSRKTNELYRSDGYGNRRVVRFDADTGKTFQSGSRPLALDAGQFHHVHRIAVDSKGHIYAAETQRKRVQKFPLKGVS